MFTDQRLLSDADRASLDDVGHGPARYPVNDDSLRITVSSPKVSMSVQTGTVLEKMTTRRPILAPRA